MHFLPPYEANSVLLVNRVDRLTLEKVDKRRLLQYATYNRLMNSFVLRICFGSDKSARKATLQIFLSKYSAMCFTRNFIGPMFQYLFHLLYKKYGVQVSCRRLCTSVWTYNLLFPVGNLGKCYSYLVELFPNFEIDYNPERFPCITILLKLSTNVTTSVRIFHTGKVVLLGIRTVDQITEVVNKLSDMFMDYSLYCNLDNFCNLKKFS